VVISSFLIPLTMCLIVLFCLLFQSKRKYVTNASQNSVGDGKGAGGRIHSTTYNYLSKKLWAVFGRNVIYKVTVTQKMLCDLNIQTRINTFVSINTIPVRLIQAGFSSILQFFGFKTVEGSFFKCVWGMPVSL